MWQGWLGDVWSWSAIVLVVFSSGGIFVGKLHKVELVGMCEELSWLGNILELNLGDFVHMLKFLNVALDFWRVGQACGRVFAQINII